VLHVLKRVGMWVAKLEEESTAKATCDGRIPWRSKESTAMPDEGIWHS
jgi:hypothetical protein